jgi:hypothetical protein
MEQLLAVLPLCSENLKMDTTMRVLARLSTSSKQLKDVVSEGCAAALELQQPGSFHLLHMMQKQYRALYCCLVTWHVLLQFNCSAKLTLQKAV